jgi:predicted DCC family thiol-disulfide oxidoreductase YuxK
MDRPDAPHAVVLFDGVCNLCNGFVQFVIPRDPDGYFRFAALGSEAAARVLSTARHAPHAPHGGPLVDSIVLVEDGVVYVRSAAALRIARHLGFPWVLGYGLTILPRPLRDEIYDLVARRRYRWFGRRETCMVPGPGVRDRFLD